MRRYRMLVFTRPTAGQEEPFNHWYQEVHLKQLVTLPGCISAQRYRLRRTLPDNGVSPYLAIYDIQTDDVDAFLEALSDATASGELVISPALDTQAVQVLIYEPLGPAVRESG